MFRAIGLQGIFSYILRDLTNALVAKDATRYYRLLEYVLLWVLVMVPVAALVLSVAAVAGTYASALVGGRLVTINFNQQHFGPIPL